MPKNSKTVSLSQYSKEELIWIINYFVKWHGDFYIERAISELEYKNQIDRINEAEKYSKTANEKVLPGYDTGACRGVAGDQRGAGPTARGERHSPPQSTEGGRDPSTVL